MIRLHRGDHGIDGAALKRVDRRGLGAVDQTKLRIARAHVEDPPLPETESHLLTS